ncbi:MAG: ABC transporter permease [Lachnospiraceae bacterium]|nr:ABC transporter permease [Lachnospiraceae bacterium]
MRLSDILGMSLTNLWRRKIRTFLTVLGVVIGTASIVVMLSLGLGLKAAMLAQVSTAGGLTEITVTSESDYGEGDLLLDDSTVSKFMELDNVKSVEPQMNFTLSMITGKYEAEDVSIIGVTQNYLKTIEIEQGKIPESKTDGSLSLIFGNQVLGESFYESATGVYPYWEREEMPDVDLLKAAIFGGIIKDDEAEEETETDMTTTVSNDVDPAFADVDNEFEGEFSDDTFSSDSSDDAGELEQPSTTETEAPVDKATDSTEQNGESGTDGSIDGFNDIDADSDSNGGSATIFTADVKRVPIKVCGITAGEDSDYTDFSYNCYADMDALKAFIHKNYTLNDIVPEQPVTKDGKPYKDLKYSQLTVNVDGSDNVEDVLQTIQDMGYRAEANKEWLEEIEKEFMIIEAVLGGIGAVAMLVAAISIANTMTMSTYERTKEIGIMKVLGCSLGNIRSMFLSEAAFIGFLGGIAGCILSFIISIILNQFLAPTIMEEYGYGENMNISVIPIWLVLLAIIFATVIGMVAGFFPAQRATKLSPLAAIRNE